MKLKIVENLDEFDSFVQNHIPTNIMQSSSWAKVKNDDWQAHYLFFEKDNKVVGSAMLLARKVIMNKYLFYAPRGPILNYDKDDEVKQALSLLKKYVKENNGFVLKFDPELPLKIFDSRSLETYSDNQQIYNKIASLTKVEPLTLNMSSSSQPRFQMVVDLQDDLLEKIKSKKRRLVKDNYLEKRGFEIIEDTSVQGIAEFARLSKLTEERQNVALRNKDYFMNMYNAFKDKNEIKVFFAQLNIENLIRNSQDEDEIKFLEDYRKKHGNLIRTNAIICIYGTDMVQMFYGASDPTFLKYKAGYALHFYAMVDAKKNGYKFFNLGGVEGTLDDGLSKFKSEFHPLVFEYMGDFDLIVNPVIYNAFNTALKIKKSLKAKK